MFLGGTYGGGGFIFAAEETIDVVAMGGGISEKVIEGVGAGGGISPFS